MALDFPKYVQNKIPVFIFGLMIAIAMFLILGLDIYVIKVILSVLLTLFCVYGLNSLNNRRRPVFDVTLWYWKLSLYMFIISMFNWLFIPQDNLFTLAIIFAFGFL